MKLADQLTVSRIVSVPVVVLLLELDFAHHYYWAASVFGLAMLTDQFDGWAARRAGASSELGRILDPVADKVLVMATLITLIDPVFSGWIVAAIVSREFLISGLRVAAIERGIVIAARDLGKLKTWAQAVSAGLGCLAAGGAISHTAAWWSLLGALAITWVSGLDYAQHIPRILRSKT
tara:strand:- start:101 stop:634 length:534 start_codon:yes stop_codon:yes gene_type:complete